MEICHSDVDRFRKSVSSTRKPRYQNDQCGRSFPFRDVLILYISQESQDDCLHVRLRAVSLFSWSFEQNSRDTQMTTRVTEGARRERLPPSFLVSRGFAAKRSRSRALPILNLKKKRDCSQSTFKWTLDVSN